MRRRSSDKNDLARRVLRGEVRAASRLLTLIENNDPAAHAPLKDLYPSTGRAQLVGVTGPAGAGKSTLINHLVAAFRKKKKSIGVLAIDPTSPFSGGAILGDRLRMHDHFLDKKVFIRSLATRGAWGGVSRTLFDAVHVMDAMGKEIIFVETVGVGQDEVQIARLADTVLLVLSPGVGDDIQMLKAGLLEIGDVVAINKGDLEGSGVLSDQIHEIASDRPVLRVAALQGEGIPSLAAEIEKRRHNGEKNRIKKMHFVEAEMRSLLIETLFRGDLSHPFSDAEIESVLLREKDPYTLAQSWIKKRGITIFSSVPE